jgi:molecular chaperone HtpG
VEKIKFQVQTSRILEILSSEIYDSPYAMLRENVQNAYDAVLMRITKEHLTKNEGLIEITITEREVIVADNGIGMNESELRNNYWVTGSSGKKTELALASGVIGTFGIGAMANFGVCSRLVVETRSRESTETLISTAIREELSISEDCIKLVRQQDDRQPGTKIIATLDEKSKITVQEAIRYLEQYIKYIPIKIIVNGSILSRNRYHDELLPKRDELSLCTPRVITLGDLKANVEVMFDKRTSRASAIITQINNQGEKIEGELVLVQNYGALMGLKNHFGLAPIPMDGVYRFGGIANISTLTPTAGREAISRESINQVQKLIQIAEWEASQQISTTEYADKNTQFMQYIVSNGLYDLATRITIEIRPEETSIELGKVEEHRGNRIAHCYSGTDPSMISTFSSEGSYLLLVSQSNPRRQIQEQYIKNKLKIEGVPDKPRRNKIYKKSELSIEELAIMVRITSIMDEFYLLSNVGIFFAEISHGVNYMVEKNGNEIDIYLNRKAASVQTLIKCYRTAHDVFDGFVNDFVRVHLYQRFSEYVPSSTKEGADALSKILKKNRELYRIDINDVGAIDKLLSDFASGKIEFPEVLKQSRTIAKQHSQIVTKTQVGRIENEIPNLTDTFEPEKIIQESEKEPILGEVPSILRLDVELQSKMLTTEKRYPILNNFEMFLGLSDRLYREDYDFFLVPHSTKVIWAAHRVIYIFTHTNLSVTLYYDIELLDRIVGESTGGGAFPTTTIVTKNRIYVPIPEALVPSFRIGEGDKKEFFVRYDLIG